jgi:ribosomal protein S18 acetylase RimI-like enzyme
MQQNCHMVSARTATPADAARIAAIHVRSWQVAYRGLLADDFLDALRPEDRMSRYHLGSTERGKPSTIVAIDHGSICGFATSGPSRDSDAPNAGEIYALYVDPESWGLGFGRLLLAKAREQLGDWIFPEALLWVLVGNEHALNFYQADRWKPDSQQREEDVWGVRANVIRLRHELP